MGGRADADSVEDFAQEAALRVLSQLQQFRGDSRFTTWAMAIAVRVAFDEMRRKRWRNVSLDELLEGGASVPSTPAHDSPERKTGRQQALNILRQTMNEKLTDKQRMALAGELKGMPQTELAARLGTTRNALYKLTHDARKRLKTALLDAGLTAESVRWTLGSS